MRLALGGGLDLDLGDAVPVERFDLDHGAVDVDGVADVWDAAELVDDVAGDGLVRPVLEGDAGDVGEVLDAEAGIDDAGARLGLRGLLGVAFPLNVIGTLTTASSADWPTMTTPPMMKR